MTNGTGPGDKTVQLGCGTLIIIAIIVAMFSGDRGSSKLRSDIRDLNKKIDRLEQKIDELSRKVGERSAPTAEREKVEFTPGR